MTTLMPWKLNAPKSDFAHLIPFNRQARYHFQKLAQALMQDNELELYARRFIHRERALVPEDNSPSRSNASRSSSDSGVCSGDDEESCKLNRGCFRYNMLSPAPTNIRQGWVLGTNDSSTSLVEMLLATVVAGTGVAARHCRFRRTPNGSVLFDTIGQQAVWMNGKFLQRQTSRYDEPRENYQCLLPASCLIQIGELQYKFEMQNLSQEDDLKQMRAAHPTLNLNIPGMLFSPTPNSNAIYIKGYQLTAAFASGAFGTVHYGTHLVTGEVFVFKKIKQYDEKTAHLIKREKGFLQRLKHESIVQLKEVVYDGFEVIGAERLDKPPTCEVYFVMSPAASLVLTNYTADGAAARGLGSSDERKCTNFALQLLIQGSAALQYLHEFQPNAITHSDIKTDNIAIVCIDPPKFSLFDFGLSQVGDAHHYPCGTERYYAPEMKKLGKGRTYGTPVDVWALGLVVLETLYRMQLKGSESSRKWFFAQLKNSIVMSNLRAGEGVENPGWWLNIVDDMLVEEPRIRPTAREVNIRARKRLRTPDSAVGPSSKRMRAG